MRVELKRPFSLRHELHQASGCLLLCTTVHLIEPPSSDSEYIPEPGLRGLLISERKREIFTGGRM